MIGLRDIISRSNLAVKTYGPDTVLGMCALWPWPWRYDLGSRSWRNLGQQWCKNIAVCKTQKPPFSNIRREGLTYDLDLWPTDLNVNRDQLLIRDYLPTKFEASGQSVPELSLHKVWETDMTFDLRPTDLTIDRDHLLIKLSVAQGLEDWHDLWPTDMTINRDHLLMKDYLPTKFEASGAKRCWVIRCTRFGRLTWPLTLTFDLVTWLSIGIIYSSRTIHLPSLKLLGQSILELSVAQGEVNWHDLWPWPLTYWPENQ